MIKAINDLLKQKTNDKQRLRRSYSEQPVGLELAKLLKSGQSGLKLAEFDDGRTNTSVFGYCGRNTAMRFKFHAMQ
ncbi:MAG: hypothetical protein N2690_09260, partial [Rhodocyclaceae bacterium]|nr:hypothetical protein [Rhodocyclaceae bacterium]